jgi:hypothetical protein
MGFTCIMIKAIRDTNTGRCVLRNESDKISQYGKSGYPLQSKL